MSQKKPAYRFEQFFATRRMPSFTTMPSGDEILFVSDISGQLNLWRSNLSGGWPQQLTLFDTESVREAAVSKDGRRIAFMADPNGNELYQIYLMDAEGGWPEAVTHQPETEHSISTGSFSPDSRYLAYSANARDPKDVDIYLCDVETGEVRMVCGGGGIFDFAGFSPDGSRMLAAELRSNTDSDIWVVDLTNGERRLLTAHLERESMFYPTGWRKDGKGFYFLTNDCRDFHALAYYDFDTDRWEFKLTSEWDVEAATVSPDGELMAYVINEAGTSVLHVKNIATGEPVAIPPLPKGVVAAVRFAGAAHPRRLFVQATNYRQAATLYVVDLAAGTTRQLTESMLGNIPDEVFVEPELVHIPTFDGLTVPAWLYRPHGIESGAKVPVALSIHGGPETQERTNYAYGGFYQYLLSQGVAVLAPNIRGSTGFGSDYQKRIHRDWGGAELKDIEACAQYLQSLPWIDSKRMAVWGGSFGGFATLSAATRLPDYWACACDFCGPSNLVTFAQSVPPHWKTFMKQWVGDPEEDREMLLERSPITYLNNLKCPLMVVQGATDPRVVKAESDQIVEKLRSQGRTVEYLVFADEGHGFTKRSNQLKGYRAIAEFLFTYLKP